MSVAGGKERVVAGLANFFATENYKVKIITYDGDAISFFPLDNNINIETHSIRSSKPAKNYALKIVQLMHDIKAYKKFESEIDDAAVVITTDHLISSIIYYTSKKNIHKVIAWEHVPFVLPMSFLWRWMRKRVYKKIRYVVALNKEEQAFYNTLGCTTVCIPNAVIKQEKVNGSIERIIWVGSLAKGKGTDDLVTLAIKLKQENMQIKIAVYGDGPEKKSMSALIEEHRLHGTIRLMGIEKELVNIYKEAGLLLLTSSFECFPTVILEAFSFGVPVISYDCPTGPHNLISEGKEGFLVKTGDVNVMVKKIKVLEENTAMLYKMSDNAYAAADKYDPHIIFSKWKELIA